MGKGKSKRSKTKTTTKKAEQVEGDTRAERNGEQLLKKKMAETAMKVLLEKGLSDLDKGKDVEKEEKLFGRELTETAMKALLEKGLSDKNVSVSVRGDKSESSINTFNNDVDLDDEYGATEGQEVSLKGLLKLSLELEIKPKKSAQPPECYPPAEEKLDKTCAVEMESYHSLGAVGGKPLLDVPEEINLKGVNDKNVSVSFRGDKSESSIRTLKNDVDLDDEHGEEGRSLELELKLNKSAQPPKCYPPAKKNLKKSQKRCAIEMDPYHSPGAVGGKPLLDVPEEINLKEVNDAGSQLIEVDNRDNLLALLDQLKIDLNNALSVRTKPEEEVIDIESDIKNVTNSPVVDPVEKNKVADVKDEDLIDLDTVLDEPKITDNYCYKLMQADPKTYEPNSDILFWPTQFRRRFYRDELNIICNCKRCYDPSELGVYLMGIPCNHTETCRQSKTSFILPEDVLDIHSNWTCLTCLLPKFTYNEIETWLLLLDAKVHGQDDYDVVNISLKAQIEQYNSIHWGHYFAFETSLMILGKMCVDIQNIARNPNTLMRNNDYSGIACCVTNTTKLFMPNGNFVGYAAQLRLAAVILMMEFAREITEKTMNIKQLENQIKMIYFRSRKDPRCLLHVPLQSSFKKYSAQLQDLEKEAALRTYKALLQIFKNDTKLLNRAVTDISPHFNDILRYNYKIHST